MTAEGRLDALALEYAAVFYATRDRALMPSSEWDLCLTAALRTYQHLGLDPENPPEEGAVGKAIGALKSLPCKCPQSTPLLRHYECFRCHALRALGGFDDNRSSGGKSSSGEE